MRWRCQERGSVCQDRDLRGKQIAVTATPGPGPRSPAARRLAGGSRGSGEAGGLHLPAGRTPPPEGLGTRWLHQPRERKWGRGRAPRGTAGPWWAEGQRGQRQPPPTPFPSSTERTHTHYQVLAAWTLSRLESGFLTNPCAERERTQLPLGESSNFLKVKTPSQSFSGYGITHASAPHSSVCSVFRKLPES